MVRLADAIKTSFGQGGGPGAKAAKAGKGHTGSGRGKKTGKAAVVQATPARIYRALLSYMEEVGECVEHNKRFDIRRGQQFIDLLVSSTPHVLEQLHQVVLHASGQERDTLACHSVHVAINAIILGQGLGYAKKTLTELGIAALFHEIGMYMLPVGLRGKKGRLSEAELATIRRHCEFASSEMKSYGPEFGDIAEVILQEHERIDGSGYPQGLQGEQIHQHALVIGLLDIYEALIHSRPHRQKISPADAMKLIIKKSKGLFPNPIIKKLLTLWSFYPVKSYVRLNDNSIGMVIRSNPLWPLKPVVKVIQNGEAVKEAGERTVDLAKNPFLYVKESMTRETLFHSLH